MRKCTLSRATACKPGCVKRRSQKSGRALRWPVPACVHEGSFTTGVVRLHDRRIDLRHAIPVQHDGSWTTGDIRVHDRRIDLRRASKIKVDQSRVYEHTMSNSCASCGHHVSVGPNAMASRFRKHQVSVGPNARLLAQAQVPSTTRSEPTASLPKTAPTSSAMHERSTSWRSLFFKADETGNGIESARQHGREVPGCWARPCARVRAQRDRQA